MTRGDLTSRRHLLKFGLLAPFAASGLLNAGAAFAQTRAGVRPFTYRAPQAALDDLKQRLARTRWPEREPVTDWSQGVPLTKLRELVDYWRGGYDWRRCERALARIPQMPVGCSILPREIFPAPRDWASKMYSNLIYWNDVARGGHFAAFEEPELFVDELRAFKRAVRAV
jgi:pimeloyl-ACP methyl ester carboxylesterase